MMIRLMTWFIELRNRFNESRLFKTSTIYVLNQVDNLTSWHKVNSDLIFNSVSDFSLWFNLYVSIHHDIFYLREFYLLEIHSIVISHKLI